LRPLRGAAANRSSLWLRQLQNSFGHAADCLTWTLVNPRSSAFALLFVVRIGNTADPTRPNSLLTGLGILDTFDPQETGGVRHPCFCIRRPSTMEANEWVCSTIR
jgi:hypothetical protein